MRDGYSVIVTHLGEPILTIERSMLSGKSDLSDDDADAIRDAADHLFSFIGPKRIEGATFVCELPHELGAVTKLSKRGSKIVAETESGTPFIVPVGK